MQKKQKVAIRHVSKKETNKQDNKVQDYFMKKLAAFFVLIQFFLHTSCAFHFCKFVASATGASLHSRKNTVMTAAMGIDVDANDGKIAIVGATGRLGREVVNNLSSKGIRSRCLIRSEDPPYFLASLPNVEFVKG